MYVETSGHLECTTDKRMTNYWLKILVQKANKITKLIYNLMLNLHENKVQTTMSMWLDRIKSIVVAFRSRS